MWPDRSSLPNPDLDSLLQAGIDAARSGQDRHAHNLLLTVVAQDPARVRAWLWLSDVVDTLMEKERCLEKVLCLDPDHDQARRGLAVLRERRQASEPIPAAAASAVPASGARQAASTLAFLRTFTQSVVLDGSRIYRSVSTAYLGWTGNRAFTALAYLAGITLAEVLVTFGDPGLGVAIHSLLLLALCVHAASAGSKTERAFLLCLAFAPLIRILSLSLPLAQIPLLYWYLITSVPLFAALLIAAPALGYSWPGLGLNLRRWPLQLAIGLTGVAFGAIEYYILRPDPLASSLAVADLWWPALILLISTGLLEEMIFRGLLQRSAGEVLAGWGLVYVAVLFAVLHIGYRSLVDMLFVLVVGLFFGWMAQRTRSLVGVTLSHGLTNIVLFLVMPFLVG